MWPSCHAGSPPICLTTSPPPVPRSRNADFQSENPAQSVTSFGGLLFMLLAAGFIASVIVLEAGPVYAVFMAGFRGRSLSGLQWVWLVVSFTLVILLCILAVVLPMRLGERRLRG